MGILGYIWITSLLLVPIVTPDPDWPRFWTLRPMIVTPLIVGVGAAVIHNIRKRHDQTMWINIFTWLLLLPLFWIATVLGLDGTLWN